MKPLFDIVYMDEAAEFIDSLPEKARNKVLYNITKSQYVIKKEIFKKLVGTEIWEFRTLYLGISHRLLAFWDDDNETLVVATHGFLKKSNKTPVQEIKKAENLRKAYFESKKEVERK